MTDQGQGDGVGGKVFEFPPNPRGNVDAVVGTVEEKLCSAKTVVEDYVEAAAECDDHLVEFFVGMSAACCAAWHVIEVVDAFDLEGDLSVFLYEGEVAPVIGDFGEIHYLAVL